MNYGLIAGFLVTLSLVLLVIETVFSEYRRSKGRAFVVLYASGVTLWLVLGVLMNDVPLVTISAIQLFCMSIFYRI
jgi:uncharacterized protein with PQ loop repeat